MIIFLSTSKLGNWSMLPTSEFQNQPIFYSIPMSGSDMVSSPMCWAASGPCDSHLWQEQEKAAASTAIEWLGIKVAAGTAKHAWNKISLGVPAYKSIYWPWCKLHHTSHLLLVLALQEKYGSGFISVLEAALKTVAVLHKAPQEYIPESLHCRAHGRHSAQCIF